MPPPPNPPINPPTPSPTYLMYDPLCWCTYSSQSNTNHCNCFGHSLFQFLLSKRKNKQKKQTDLHERFHHGVIVLNVQYNNSMISYSSKALMNFHHDAPNCHVPLPAINQFLAHGISITSYHQQIANLQSVPVKAILYLQKILPIGKITFLLSYAACTLCSLVSKQRFTRDFPVSQQQLSKNG